MSVWTKVLLGLVAVAALVFFHASLRTIKTFQHWSSKCNEFERRLADVRKDIVALRTADHEHPLDDKTFGVPQLRFDLGRMLTNRGRIWTNCQKKGMQQDKAGNGRWEATVTSDDAGYSDKMLLYAFEEGDDQAPGKYLGEFAVKAVSQNNNIVLVSTTPLTQVEQKRLANSKSTWVLYEMMPSDQHELFASLPDDLRKKFFPDPDPGLSKADQEKWKTEKWWLPEEYLLDGQIVNGKPYERKLRDYLEIMRVCEVERTLYDDRVNSLQRDENYLKSTKDDSEKQLAFAEKEKAQAVKERAWEFKQRDAAAAHFASLQKMLELNAAAVKAAMVANAEAARQIAKIQKDAAEQIDRRTHSMARYGAGAN
jgi:hypothetical protein